MTIEIDATRNVAGITKMIDVRSIDERQTSGDPEDMVLTALLVRELERDFKTDEYLSADPKQIQACRLLVQKAAAAVARNTHVTMVAGMDESGLELILHHDANGRRVVYVLSADGVLATIYRIDGAMTIRGQLKTILIPVMEHFVWLAKQ